MPVMFARVLRFQAVLVMIGLFGALDPALAQSKKLKPLHIALANHSVSMTAIYVAKHLGIFAGYGYDARILVLEPRAGIGALLSGDLDCYSAIGSTARAALRGAPVRVGLVSLNRSDFILVANKDISSIEQLRGKVIGGYTPQEQSTLFSQSCSEGKACVPMNTRW